MIPTAGRAAVQAEQDLASGETWSPENLSLRRRLAVIGGAMSVIVAVTVYVINTL